MNPIPYRMGIPMNASMPNGWIAAEARVARALRTYAIDVLGHPKTWMKAAGYWSRGQAEIHEKIGD